MRSLDDIASPALQAEIRKNRTPEYQNL
jgi:hypothetical protein